MDWYPLLNSLRIAAISAVVVFFAGIAAAYYIAVSIADPVAALMVFFAAVGMVILATYMIFISGSVLLCRILQKNRQPWPVSEVLPSI